MENIVVKDIQPHDNEPKTTKDKYIESPSRLVIKRLKKNKLAMFGLVLLIFMVLFSFIGPLFMSYGYNSQSSLIKNAPTTSHILGTDYLGRDVLTRLMYGGRISILVGVIAVFIEMLIGTLIGAISGYYGGRIDSALMSVTDVFLSLPFMPIVLICGSLMSDLKLDPIIRIFLLMFVIGILSWPSITRLVRGEILSLREQEFMQATEALGLRDIRKILNHLIPNVIPTIIVNATLGVADAIILEATLSYLGVGVVEPIPSWGNLMDAANSIADFKNRAWLWIPPGLCILLTVMAVNLVGDGLRDALDPKMKR